MDSNADLAAQFTAFLNTVDGIVWGPAMLVLLLGTGLYLTLGTLFMPMRRIPTAFRLLFRGRHAGAGDKGDITPFQSLMTALSATIGNGNIVGVAAAIALGGPGAVFWMWMTALVGMATKYSEAVLAIKYREVDADGRYVGGPMYYIKNGLGRHWAWLGFTVRLLRHHRRLRHRQHVPGQGRGRCGERQSRHSQLGDRRS